MNLQELTTWSRLATLDFDAANASLPFSARLARDNGWPRRFAARALEEYRKFCFLAAHAGHPVTPSDEVDQVWHLHLTYSQHYWNALCRETLGRPLHHGPTQGGAAENRKYRDWYEATLKAYRRYFGEPPNDLWPASGDRFHERNEYVRINRRDVVTIDRSRVRRGALFSLTGATACVAAGALAQAEGTSAGPGLVFGALIAVVLPLLLIAVALRGRRRRGNRASKPSRNDGAAAASGFVAGGGSSGKASGDDAGSDGGSSGCGGGAAGCGGGGCGGGG